LLPRGKRAFWGQKYTKYNEINSNSRYFRGARLLPGGGDIQRDTIQFTIGWRLGAETTTNKTAPSG